LRLTEDWHGRVHNKGVSAYTTAEGRQNALDKLRLMRPELFHVTKIETWEVVEPLITLHDPEDYRPCP